MNPLTPLAYCVAAWFASKTLVILTPYLASAGRSCVRGGVMLWIACRRSPKFPEIEPVEKLKR